MAIVIESVGTGTGTDSAAVVTKPSGTAIGDLLLVHVAWIDNTAATSVTPPAGWTEIQFTSQAITGDAAGFIYQYTASKIATSTETAASNFTFTANNSGIYIGRMLRISGVRQASAIAASAEATLAEAAGTTLTIGSVTPALANSMFLFFTSIGYNAVSGFSAHAMATSNPVWNEEYVVGVDDGGYAVTIGSASSTRPETTASGNNTVTVANAEGSIGHMVVVSPLQIISKTETVTVSDTKVIGMSIVKTESVTVTDNDEETIGKYRNKDKSSSNYTNLDKS